MPSQSYYIMNNIININDIISNMSYIIDRVRHNAAKHSCLSCTLQKCCSRQKGKMRSADLGHGISTYIVEVVIVVQ